MATAEEKMSIAANRLQSWLDEAAQNGAAPPQVDPIIGEDEMMPLMKVKVLGQGNNAKLRIVYGFDSDECCSLEITSDEVDELSIRPRRMKFQADGEPGEITR